MQARSITLMADPARLDEGIAHVRDEIMPLIMGMDGALGLSMLVDRDSGHCIVTSSWVSEEAMHASNEGLSSSRTRTAEIMGGSPRAAGWEVAVMHRDHAAPEGSCCRATWLRLNHVDTERGVALYRSVMLPEMESLDGFCSASLLVDRVAGRACSTTTYDSRSAMEASRERSWTIRDAGVRDAGVDVMDVVEFDLVLAHLRVPELV